MYQKWTKEEEEQEKTSLAGASFLFKPTIVCLYCRGTYTANICRIVSIHILTVLFSCVHTFYTHRLLECSPTTRQKKNSKNACCCHVLNSEFRIPTPIPILTTQNNIMFHFKYVCVNFFPSKLIFVHFVLLSILFLRTTYRNPHREHQLRCASIQRVFTYAGWIKIMN